MQRVNFVNFKEELKKQTEEAQNIIFAFLPAEEGFTAPLAEAVNYNMRAPGKKAEADTDAGDVPYVWRQRSRGGSVYGGDRDDTYTFPDP